MKIKHITKLSVSDLLVIPCFEEKNLDLESLMKNIPGLNAEKTHLPSSADFSGKEGEMIVTYIASKKIRRVLFLGCGKKEKCDTEGLRKLASRLRKHVNSINVSSMILHLWYKEFLSDESIEAFLTGFILSNYSFSKYKTKKDDNKLLNFYVYTSLKTKNYKKLITKTQKMMEAVMFARDLVNIPSNEKYPEKLAYIAQKEIRRPLRIKKKILNEKQIKKLKLGLLEAVGKGSKYPPRLIELHYKSRTRKSKTVLLVGKGVTFDTGGINLKVSGSSIVTMKLDMAGGATVMGIFKMLASGYDLPVNLIGIIGAVENMVGSGASRPGDIVTAYNGKTVEITNTDAEGRLVLADCLAYGIKKYKPDYVIDIATLTGACLVALGYDMAGVIGTDENLVKVIKEASNKTGEKIWQLPINKDFIEATKGDVSDLKNYTSNVRAGTIMGGAFIHEFIDKKPWVHIDIAGTAWAETAKDYISKGGTGWGVRLLWEVLNIMS